MGHQARSDAPKKEKPLTNQRLIGILVEAESTELGHSSIYENKGSSLCNHVKDTPLINANDGPAVKSTALRRHVFAAARLYANDTPLPVLAPATANLQIRTTPGDVYGKG